MQVSAIAAAQLFAAAKRELGDLDAMIARGEFAPLREWLREKVQALIEGRRRTAVPLQRHTSCRRAPALATSLQLQCPLWSKGSDHRHSSRRSRGQMVSKQDRDSSAAKEVDSDNVAGDPMGSASYITSSARKRS